MGVLATAVLVLVGLLAVWFVSVLWRQGHPEDELDRDLPETPGPTGVQYPTGSRPAGPGAERMIRDPSEKKGER